MVTKQQPYHKSAYLIRVFRKLHRQIAVALFVFFLIISLTGLLLGWKKNCFGLILPSSSKGVSSDLKTWLPFDSLHTIAINTLRDSVSASLSDDIERIDARPKKGIVKFVFSQDYWEIQLDGTNGNVLFIGRRRSDIIEHLHDGTIFDVIFNTEYGQFKLFYTSVMGLALLMLTITGLWLWYGPKRLLKKKNTDAVKLSGRRV